MTLGKYSRPFLALCLTLSSCSILYDLSPDQCGTNSDCVSQFGSGYSCKVGICEGSPVAANPDGGPPDEEGCQTHRECIEELGDVDPHACVEGECVPLVTEQCPLLLPLQHEQWLENLKTSDALIFGVYSQVPQQGRISNYTRFFDLAVDEFTQEVGGLPSASGKRRQVVMLVCDAVVPDRESLAASASHLIEELQVPAILSTLAAEDLQYVFDEFGREAKTFMLSAFEADDALLNLQDDGLVWTMLAGPDEVAASVPALVERIIAHQKREGALQADEDVKVALVAPTGSPRLLHELGEVLTKTVYFNGKSAADNFTDGLFRSINITTIHEDPEEAQEQASVVSALLEFEPDIVLAMASHEFIDAVLPALENQWDDDAQNLPFYVLSPFNLDSKQVTTAIENIDGLRTRLLGLAFAAAENPDIYRDYLIRLETAYPEIGTDATRLGKENFYDAPYYLLYAAAAAGNPPRLTGDLIAEGMTRLLNGPEYTLGRSDMREAMNFLQSDVRNTILLNGTLGPASFNPSTGARTDGGSIYCLNRVNEFVPDVLRWNSEDKEFVETEGSIDNCIKDF